MKLSDLKEKESARIVRIDSSSDFKQRLGSFGVIRGSELIVQTYSLAHQTIEIMVDDTLIGMRSSEAALIEVEVLGAK